MAYDPAKSGAQSKKKRGAPRYINITGDVEAQERAYAERLDDPDSLHERVWVGPAVEGVGAESIGEAIDEIRRGDR